MQLPLEKNAFPIHKPARLVLPLTSKGDSTPRCAPKQLLIVCLIYLCLTNEAQTRGKETKFARSMVLIVTGRRAPKMSARREVHVPDAVPISAVDTRRATWEPWMLQRSSAWAPLHAYLLAQFWEDFAARPALRSTPTYFNPQSIDCLLQRAVIVSHQLHVEIIAGTLSPLVDVRTVPQSHFLFSFGVSMHIQTQRLISYRKSHNATQRTAALP